MPKLQDRLDCPPQITPRRQYPSQSNNGQYKISDETVMGILKSRAEGMTLSGIVKTHSVCRDTAQKYVELNVDKIEELKKQLPPSEEKPKQEIKTEKLGMLKTREAERYLCDKLRTDLFFGLLAGLVKDKEIKCTVTNSTRYFRKSDLDAYAKEFESKC